MPGIVLVHEEPSGSVITLRDGREREGEEPLCRRWSSRTGSPVRSTALVPSAAFQGVSACP
jgi:hypothetical protein